jgi:hypothetical protein
LALAVGFLEILFSPRGIRNLLHDKSASIFPALGTHEESLKALLLMTPCNEYEEWKTNCHAEGWTLVIFQPLSEFASRLVNLFAPLLMELYSMIRYFLAFLILAKISDDAQR